LLWDIRGYGVSGVWVTRGSTVVSLAWTIAIMMAALPRASASEITPSPAKTAARPTGVKPSQCAVTRPVARQSFVFPFVLRVFSFRPFQDRCRVAVPRGPPSTSRIYPQALCRAAASTFGTRTIPLSTQATPHTPRFPFRDRDSPRLSGLLSGNRQSWVLEIRLRYHICSLASLKPPYLDALMCSNNCAL